MRCIYCGVAELTNDHGCVGCGAPKDQSPEGMIWPYRLPRDEAEKAQLEAEKLRNDVRLQFRRMKETEAAAKDENLGAFALCLLVLLMVVPLLLQFLSAAFFHSIL